MPLLNLFCCMVPVNLIAMKIVSKSSQNCEKMVKASTMRDIMTEYFIKNTRKMGN